MANTAWEKYWRFQPFLKLNQNTSCIFNYNELLTLTVKKTRQLGIKVLKQYTQLSKQSALNFISIDFNLLPPHPYQIRLLYFLGHPNPLRITFFLPMTREYVSQVLNVTILYNNVLLHALIKFNCLFSLPK